MFVILDMLILGNRFSCECSIFDLLVIRLFERKDIHYNVNLNMLIVGLQFLERKSFMLILYYADI
jgi:hypothetical protein